MGRKFSDIKREGQKRLARSGGNTSPFIIDLDDNESIKINFPDAQTYLALGKVDEGDTLGILRVMFSENPRDFNRLIEELQGEPVQVLSVLVEDMWAFWNENLAQTAGKEK